MDEVIRVRDIMNSNPVIISRKASVLDATKEMKSERVGSIIITENGKPIGVLTESDILRKIVAEEKDAAKTSVDEIMSSPPVTIEEDATIQEAVRMMGEHKIRRLPVVKNGKLVGMITERDILQASPFLMDIIEEWAEVARERLSYRKGEQKYYRGKCEECGMLSNRLIEVNGRLLCESCAEALR